MAPLTGTANEEGFWGPATSTIDWCEENYLVTKYLAEFWNTISNWLFMIPPFFGALLACKNELEKRYIISFISLCVVGIGSLCFHATLLYEMQLLDELPMIYGTCIFIFCIFECSYQPQRHDTTLLLVLTVICAMVTLVYLTVVNPLIFQWAYGLLVATLVVVSVKACRKYKGSWRLLSISFASYSIGFILWNIDNNFCPKVREIRNALSPLLVPFLQLHAVWHTLAGIGSYYHVLFSVDLRLRCLCRAPYVKFSDFSVARKLKIKPSRPIVFGFPRYLFTYEMSRDFLPFVYPGEKSPPEIFQSVVHKASIFVLLCGTILKLLSSGF